MHDQAPGLRSPDFRTLVFRLGRGGSLSGATWRMLALVRAGFDAMVSFAFYFPMQSPTKERWLELCEQAAKEQDSQKLLALMQEINRLLAEKQDRLMPAPKNVKSSSL